MNVIERYEALHQTRSHLQLFALLDGLGYEQLNGERLQAGPGRTALFEGTPDAALSSAGPWLIDAAQGDDLREHLLATRRKRRMCRGCLPRCRCLAWRSCCS